MLNSIARKANLNNPETVKEYLANATCSDSRKERLTWELIRFYKWKNIPFQPPHYKPIDKLPFIPLETEIDALISGSGRKTACLLQLLKETGMRAGEAYAAKWTDIDLEQSRIIVQPEKGSRSRTLKVSSRLISMLNRLPKNSQHIFRQEQQDHLTSLKTARRNFERQRKRLSIKLQNPRLNQIHLHTLRHFFATMTYNRTRDILYTMRQLGHHNIMHTLRYTQLVDWPTDQYVCKVAETVNDATMLIESGYEYVTDFNGTKLFRKRK
jgi:integrase/recombinase XerD